MLRFQPLLGVGMSDMSIQRRIVCSVFIQRSQTFFINVTLFYVR